MNKKSLAEVAATLWAIAHGEDPDAIISDAGHTVVDGVLSGWSSETEDRLKRMIAALRDLGISNNNLDLELPDGSAFFVAEIDVEAPPRDPWMWNPYNKVFQDHRDGTINHERTNQERAKRGLPVPWTPELVEVEIHQKSVI